MNTQTRSLNEITQQAIELLSRELGVVATLRFLSQFTTGYGDYTEERRFLYENLTMDQALESLKTKVSAD
jgi:hypothetical protein